MSTGLPMQKKKGLHGGTVSTIQLKLNITKDMNGAVYTCQAMNEVLQRSVHDALALKVLCEYFFVVLCGKMLTARLMKSYYRRLWECLIPKGLSVS